MRNERRIVRCEPRDIPFTLRWVELLTKSVNGYRCCEWYHQTTCCIAGYFIVYPTQYFVTVCVSAAQCNSGRGSGDQLASIVVTK